MKESCGEGPASHPDPESCGSGRKASAEALTGAHAGQPSSCEIRQSGVPTLLSEAEGHTGIGVIGEPVTDPAQSETLCMRGHSSRGNREVPSPPAADGATGRPEKATSRTSGIHGEGKSDGRIVCAGQRDGQEGSSPSGARMRGAVSESGGNSSLAEERKVWRTLTGHEGESRTQPRATCSHLS
jgi:RNA-directed DNA polymerase